MRVYTCLNQLLQVMSPTSTDQPATLDGEVLGPDYARQQGGMQGGVGLLNGTASEGVQQSGNGSVPVSGAAVTGSGATYGSVDSLNESVAGIRNAGRVSGASQRLEAAQALQQPTTTQPLQQPATTQALQQPATTQPLQQPATTQPLQQPATTHASQQPVSAQGPQQPIDPRAVPQAEATQVLQQSAATQPSRISPPTQGPVQPQMPTTSDHVPHFGRRGDGLRESLMTSGPMEQQQGRELRHPPLRLTSPRRPMALREFEQSQEPQGQVAGVPQGDVHGMREVINFFLLGNNFGPELCVGSESGSSRGCHPERLDELRGDVPTTSCDPCCECEQKLCDYSHYAGARGCANSSSFLLRGSEGNGGS